MRWESGGEGEDVEAGETRREVESRLGDGADGGDGGEGRTMREAKEVQSHSPVDVRAGGEVLLNLLEVGHVADVCFVGLVKKKGGKERLRWLAGEDGATFG